METAMLANIGDRLAAVQKKTWIAIAIAVVVVVAFFVVRRNWNKLKGSLQRDYGNYEDGTPATISDDRKEELEHLAEQLKESMESWAPGTTRETYMGAADMLPDYELKYLANYFEKALTRGESLYYWVDWEFMSGSLADDNLLTHLAKIGEKDA